VCAIELPFNNKERCKIELPFIDDESTCVDFVLPFIDEEEV